MILRSLYGISITVLLAGTQFASAAVLTWDASGANPVNPVDGTGVWDTDSLNPNAVRWSNGASDAAWSNANNDTAVFGNANGSAGTVTLNTGITAGGITFNAATSGSYVVTGNTLTLAGTTPTISANVDATINSIIAGSVGLTKAGTGTLIVGAANTYSGGTKLDAGILSYTAANNIGAGTISLNGGALRYSGSATNVVVNRALDLSTAGGTLENAATGTGYVNYTGAITYSGSGNRILTLAGNSASTLATSVQGNITNGAGGVTSLVKDGTSYWGISGTNTYSGDTTVKAGILYLNGNDKISTNSTVYLNSGATIQLGGNQTFKDLQDGTGGGGTITQSFNNNTTFVATVQSGSFSGRFIDAGGTARRVGVTKDTVGTLRLSGNLNTYTGGTTISAGTLLINNTTATSSGLGTGAVSVTSGTTATLGGNGFVALGSANSISIGSNGVISPGDSAVSGGIGSLTLNGGSTTGAILDMQAGSKFNFDLGASNANDTVRFFNYAGASDFLRNSGGIALNFSGAQAGTYDLFQFYSNAGTTLVNAGFDEGTSNFVLGTGLSGFNATWDYSTTGVISLTLTAVPEPTTVGLAMFGLFIGVLTRQRK